MPRPGKAASMTSRAGRGRDVNSSDASKAASAAAIGRPVRGWLATRTPAITTAAATRQGRRSGAEAGRIERGPRGRVRPARDRGHRDEIRPVVALRHVTLHQVVAGRELAAGQLAHRGQVMERVESEADGGVLEVQPRDDEKTGGGGKDEEWVRPALHSEGVSGRPRWKPCPQSTPISSRAAASSSAWIPS